MCWASTAWSVLVVLIGSTTPPEGIDDFCFDSLGRFLVAAFSLVEQAHRHGD